jgi:hypothetical protein
MNRIAPSKRFAAIIGAILLINSVIQLTGLAEGTPVHIFLFFIFIALLALLTDLGFFDEPNKKEK